MGQLTRAPGLSLYTQPESTPQPSSEAGSSPARAGGRQPLRHSQQGGPLAPGPRAPGDREERKTGPGTSQPAEASSKAFFLPVSPHTFSLGREALARTVTAGTLRPGRRYSVFEDRAGAHCLGQEPGLRCPGEAPACCRRCKCGVHLPAS